MKLTLKPLALALVLAASSAAQAQTCPPPQPGLKPVLEAAYAELATVTKQRTALEQQIASQLSAAATTKNAKLVAAEDLARNFPSTTAQARLWQELAQLPATTYLRDAPLVRQAHLKSLADARISVEALVQQLKSQSASEQARLKGELDQLKRYRAELVAQIAAAEFKLSSSFDVARISEDAATSPSAMEEVKSRTGVIWATEDAERSLQALRMQLARVDGDIAGQTAFAESRLATANRALTQTSEALARANAASSALSALNLTFTSPLKMRDAALRAEDTARAAVKTAADAAYQALRAVEELNSRLQYEQGKTRVMLNQLNEKIAQLRKAVEGGC